MNFHPEELNTFFLQTQQEEHTIDHQNTQLIQRQSLKQIKIPIISFLLLAFFSYRFLHQTSLSPGQCIKDMTHQFTEFINVQLNKDGEFAYYFIVIGQLFIDSNLIMFMIFQIFKMENLFLSIFIGLFYATRAIFLNIVKFPYPLNVYWKEPGFPPSIGVPYGITSDYFYSGHTGMMLFSLLFWSQKNQTCILKNLSYIGLPYIIQLVNSSRDHYVIDVFAAIFFCLWIYGFTRKYLIKFDTFFTHCYSISIYLLGYFEMWVIFVLNMKKKKKESII